MESGIFIGLSRDMALNTRMDVVANNIANINTTGFKSGTVIFNELIERPRMQEKLSYVQDTAVAYNHGGGKLEATGNPFDLAIEGDGYFALESPGGERYTRAGSFSLNPDGELVNREGWPVLNENGNPIFVPGDVGPIVVGEDGAITTEGGAQIADLRIVSFDNPQTLRRAGANAFMASEPPQEADQARVLQGMLEGSNVEPIREITEMISVHRSSGQVDQLMSGEDERIRKAIQRLGRPSGG